MEERRIGTIEELVGAPRKLIEQFNYTTPWFRGHGRSDWSLRAPVHRDYNSADERDMLANFMLQAPSRHRDCPGPTEGDGGARADWLCLMRHYGLPTRLLDWTESILVAAFFAVDPRWGPQSADGAIWALYPGGLNKASGHGHRSLELRHPDLRGLVNAAFDAEVEADGAAAVVSPQIDLRMMLQQAAFTIHGSPVPLDKAPENEGLLVKYLVPAKVKSGLAMHLNFLGIHQASLFPDLGHLARHIALERTAVKRFRQWKGLPEME